VFGQALNAIARNARLIADNGAALPTSALKSVDLPTFAGPR